MGWFHQKIRITLCIWRVGRSKAPQSFLDHNKDVGIYFKGNGNLTRVYTAEECCDCHLESQLWFNIEIGLQRLGNWVIFIIAVLQLFYSRRHKEWI